MSYFSCVLYPLCLFLVCLVCVFAPVSCVCVCALSCVCVLCFCTLCPDVLFMWILFFDIPNARPLRAASGAVGPLTPLRFFSQLVVLHLLFPLLKIKIFAVHIWPLRVVKCLEEYRQHARVWMLRSKTFGISILCATESSTIPFLRRGVQSESSLCFFWINFVTHWSMVSAWRNWSENEILQKIRNPACGDNEFKNRQSPNRNISQKQKKE